MKTKDEIVYDVIYGDIQSGDFHVELKKLCANIAEKAIEEDRLTTSQELNSILQEAWNKHPDNPKEAFNLIHDRLDSLIKTLDGRQIMLRERLCQNCGKKRLVDISNGDEVIYKTKCSFCGGYMANKNSIQIRSIGEKNCDSCGIILKKSSDYMKQE